MIKAAGLIFENIEKAYKNGNDLNARAKMLRTSYLAGIAFSKNYVGYIHAVAHSLGGRYGIPHGLANAVLLPHVLKAYKGKATVRLAKLAYASGICVGSCPTGKAAAKFIHHIEILNKKMGIPQKLKGISPKLEHLYYLVM